MRATVLWPCVLAVAAAGVCGGEPARPPIAEALGLKAAARDDADVYYAPGLEAHLDIAVDFHHRLIEAARREKAVRNDLLARAEAIIDEVNRITASTPTPAQRDRQQDTLKRFLTFRPIFGEGRGPVRLYVVDSEAAKEYLRQGGTLPGCSYHKATDTAEFQVRLDLAHGPPDAPIDLLIPVGDRDRVGLNLRESCNGMAEAVKPWMGGVLALHELVEITLLYVRLRPKHTYWRWFSDGMANAVAEHLAGKYLGADVAKGTAEIFDAALFSDIKEEVNLAWWLPSDHAVFEGTPPLKDEARLRLARYAFATHEAKRLVATHGLECLPRILDAASRDDANTREGLVATIAAATGEDMADRLRAYQTFDTAREGWDKYEQACRHAMARKDAVKAAVAMLRLRELADGVRPDCDGEAAYLVFRTGFGAEADAFLRKRIRWLAERNASEPLVAMQNVFCAYALRTNHPEKAYEVAERVLENEADAVPALQVRMERLVREKRLDEAKAVARRIARLQAADAGP